MHASLQSACVFGIRTGELFDGPFFSCHTWSAGLGLQLQVAAYGGERHQGMGTRDAKEKPQSKLHAWGLLQMFLY